MVGIANHIGKRIRIFYDDLEKGGSKEGILLSVSETFVEVQLGSGQVQGILINKIIRYEVFGGKK